MPVSQAPGRTRPIHVFDPLCVNSNLALPPLKTWQVAIENHRVAAGDSDQDSNDPKFDGERICEISREIVVVDRELSNVRRRNDVLGPENEMQVHAGFAISSNPGDTNLNLPTPSYAEHRDGVKPANPGEVWDLPQFTQHHMSRKDTQQLR